MPLIIGGIYISSRRNKPFRCCFFPGPCGQNQGGIAVLICHIYIGAFTYKFKNNIIIAFLRRQNKRRVQAISFSLGWEPFARSSFTSNICPIFEAIISGVCPNRSFAFTSAPDFMSFMAVW